MGKDVYGRWGRVRMSMGDGEGKDVYEIWGG